MGQLNIRPIPFYHQRGNASITHHGLLVIWRHSSVPARLSPHTGVVGRWQESKLPQCWGLCEWSGIPWRSRLDAPGVLHHLMIRGIEPRKIFSSLLTPQLVRRLLSVMLPLKSLHLQGAMEIVEHHTNRKLVATRIW